MLLVFSSLCEKTPGTREPARPRTRGPAIILPRYAGARDGFTGGSHAGVTW
jgi:hypothetical protein